MNAFVSDMNLLVVNGFLLLALLVLGSASSLLMDPEIPVKKCRYNRIYSMLQTMCSELGLIDVPVHLKPSMQVNFGYKIVLLTNLKNEGIFLPLNKFLVTICYILKPIIWYFCQVQGETLSSRVNQKWECQIFLFNCIASTFE